jgi:thiol-disulfide isomerase/thioredoxin
MLRRPALIFPGLQAVLSFILIVASASSAEAQAARAQLAETPTDAFTLLKQVGQRYANAAYYRIEAVKEEQMNADFSRNWSKSVTTAVFAPGNKYRFEAHTNWEWWVLVSDGKTEWLYSPAAQEYKEQTAPDRGPSRFESSGLRSFISLTEAQDTFKNLAELPSSAKTASYLPDETLILNGKQTSCYVIDVQGKYLPGWSPDTTSMSTVWVEKENHVVRKLHEHMEGPLIMGRQEKYVSDKTTVYTVVELEATAVSEGLFAFTPPSNAKLVKEFESPMRTRTEAPIIGKPAPDVMLSSQNGKTISLRSFQGKPVLLDFWATWCGPCVESMPSVSRLYAEAAKYGLILLSIDEDNDAEKATNFLSKNKESWPNFHDDGEIVRLFPNEGIPHFVLIDSSGKVVFSRSSFDESAMRAAIAGLGAEFASINKTSQP